MAHIAEGGAAFSEWAPTTHPEAWHFPTRNRLIAALSLGVVVVEASQKSGSLITADCALEQGREVFAVPGNVMRPGSRGPHALIRQGATLVESAEQIVEALNARVMPLGGAFMPSLERPASASPNANGEGVASRKATAQQAKEAPVIALASPELTPEQNAVYTAIDEEPRHLDEIAARANMGAAQATVTLVMLELRQLVRRHAGGLFSRTF
jgi:DNA processing protein